MFPTCRHVGNMPHKQGGSRRLGPPDGRQPRALEYRLVGRVLRRSDVIGQPIADQAFAIVDAVLAQDTRVAELLGPWRMGPAPRRPWWKFW